MNIAQLIADIVPSAAVIIAALFGVGHWVGKVEQNTQATEKLTSAFETHAEKVGNQVSDHEVRIRLLESESRQTFPNPAVIQPVVSSSEHS